MEAATTERAAPDAPSGTPDGTVSSGAERRFQAEILPHVSRTFAITIPELPEPLCGVVTNAYLLCRIADTIEDDAELDAEAKGRWSRRFVAVVEGREPAEPFARGLAPALSARTPPKERELVARSAEVVRLTHAARPAERAALARCVRIMCEGMERFQLAPSPRGLADVAELDRYCYHVAGVVGEMLTELFCEHSSEIAARRDLLTALAVSFGQGLQMTNILKDVWDDRERGACWLPRDVFEARGFELAELSPERHGAPFAAGMTELVGLAARHLRNAFAYTMLIPPRERGIRTFCLRALGLAVLTLRKIHRHPEFTSTREVKVTRRTVRSTILVTDLCRSHDRVLRLLFAAASRGLPAADRP